jgi:hypothetical protein
MTGRDILARAKNGSVYSSCPLRLMCIASGTGKTAAYLIPVLEKIDVTKNTIQGLFRAALTLVSYRLDEDLILHMLESEACL